MLSHIFSFVTQVSTYQISDHRVAGKNCLLLTLVVACGALGTTPSAWMQ